VSNNAIVVATVLIENVDHHIDEEEGGWFPEVRQALGRMELPEIGEQPLEAEQKVPRRPAQPGALRKATEPSSAESNPSRPPQGGPGRAG
jgi:hypothetical protein